MQETQDLLKMWENSSPEFQNANMEMFKQLLEERRDYSYGLIKLMDATKDDFFQNNGQELVNLIKEDKNNFSFAIYLWAMLPKQIQLENVDLFEEMLQHFKTDEMEVEDLWKKTDGELQKEFFPNVLDIDKVLEGSNFLLSLDYFKQYLASRQVPFTEDQIEVAYEKYSELYGVNPNVNSTINLYMLDETILSRLGKEQLVRLTMYPELQEQILNLKGNKAFLDLIENICNSSPNWSIELNSVMQNIDEYADLLENISEEQLDTSLQNNLIQVLAQKKNYFQITNHEQLENFDDIRREQCLQILNGYQDIQIEGLNENDKMKFAILELLYGIDLDEATNIVQKYGAEIEKIDDNVVEKSTIATIIGIKRLLDCPNVQELFEQNREVFESDDIKNIKYSSIANLETSCLNMYEQLYSQELYEPKEIDKSGVVEYNGETIDVYEIKDNFSMFIRTEGACNGYKEPENFADAINRPTTKYHGNCKSFVAQDLLAIASGKGPKFGYSNCKKNSMNLCAPWDIMSNSVNSDFSIASARWDENNGIEFMTPQGLKDNTRYGYNEIVSERLIFNHETERFENDMPQYIVYVEEPGINKEDNDLWRISKKAASQMKLPIVVINRERFAIKEANEIKKLEDIFIGKTENIDNIPETELLERIITKFENNAVGSRGSKIITEKYFSISRRNEIISNVWKRIKSFESTDIQKYAELIDKFIEVSTNEQAKTTSNTGARISAPIYGDNFINSLKDKRSKIVGLEEPKKNTDSVKDKLLRNLCKICFRRK